MIVKTNNEGETDYFEGYLQKDETYYVRVRHVSGDEDYTLEVYKLGN